jgi:hypothetical protein
MIRPRRLLLPVTALTAALVLLASARPPQAGERHLDELMGLMRRHYKTATQGASDPGQNAETLAALAEIEALILAAKRLEPTNLSEIPSDARGEHTRLFRATMARLLSEVALAEAELWQGQNEAAAKRLATGVREIRDEGHEQFQPADEH